MKVTMEFVRCMDESPKVDGYYHVARMSRDGALLEDVTSLNYTVGGGWNTHRDYKGVLYDLDRLLFEKTTNRYWAKEVIVEGKI